MTWDLAWAPPPPLGGEGGGGGGGETANKTFDFSFVVYIIVQLGLSQYHNLFLG